MIEIPLTKGYTALVDDEDADLAEISWYVSLVSKSNNYAIRKTGAFKKQRNVLMHRLILGRIVGRELKRNEYVDHKDGNGLNNSRQNLRICTQEGNTRNSRIKENHSTGFKGVSKNPNSKVKPFRAHIRINNKLKHLGTFATAEEAHAAYCEAGRKYFGEFFRAA